MSAAVATATWEPDDGWIRRVLAGPAEGWVALAGLIVMIVSLGWSIDDANWVPASGPTSPSLTGFLPHVGLAGIVVGFVGAKVGWGRWTTHLIGVAFAALILPIIAGGIVLGDSVTGFGPAALAARYDEAARIVTQVWFDLVVHRFPLTSQYGHYFIGLGAVMWAAGQFAAYAVFGHRRVLDAVIVTGLLMLANMAIAPLDIHLLVLFSIAALALLSRAHAFDEQSTWLRRRIGDPGEVTGLYLRGGATFITAAVLASVVLTFTASSAPLQDLWTGAPGTVARIVDWLRPWLPPINQTRTLGAVPFGESATIVGTWSPASGVAFTAKLPAGETGSYKWLVATYARFDRNQWTWGTTATRSRAAGSPLLAGLADDPSVLLGRTEVTVTIKPQSLQGGAVVSPEMIASVDEPSTLRTVGVGGWLTSVEANGSSSYTVEALVPVFGPGPDQVTANRLRAASRDYPPEIVGLYGKSAVPVGAIGVEARKILDAVIAGTPDGNPYDLALNLQNYLLDPAHFQYDTNVAGLVGSRCAGLSTVECFAVIHRGYCQFYATTMAILLREAGVPTRFVQGFLPGNRSANGTEVVNNSAAHAWVQVYFPGYGWIDFDPTGGGVGQPTTIPSGPPESPTPAPSRGQGTAGPRASDEIAPRSFGPGGGGGNTTGGGTSNGPFIVIAILLGIGALSLASIAWRRGPRPMHPDRAWGSIAGWAARFGLGPRPSQTVYEYAGVLGDAVPAVRPELSTVAHAKVVMAYAHESLDEDELRIVAAAHRRLRIGLLRLMFRRPSRRHGPRATGRRG
jgi:hypothetical protein